jgi:hypothetical protein
VTRKKEVAEEEIEVEDIEGDEGEGYSSETEVLLYNKDINSEIRDPKLFRCWHECYNCHTN